MKLLLGWLEDYVKTYDLSAEELQDKLMSIGFETEKITFLGEPLNMIYAGRVASVRKHPQNPNLFVCLIDLGLALKLDVFVGVKNAPNEQLSDNSAIKIITSAKGLCEGMNVLVALPGAKIGGKTIEAVDFDGEKSMGMLCSVAEIGIDFDLYPTGSKILAGTGENGLVILPDDCEKGTSAVEVLDLNDFVMDISVPASRPDCQSVYGLARELAAVLGRKFKPMQFKYNVSPSEKTAALSVRVEEKDLCPLYTGTHIKKVKVEKSPLWMRLRLDAVGIRPINNIVDITNYVLIETGQPLHAFDASQIDGGIVVRRALPKEKITALDGEEYALSANDLVIADHKKALAIAGVMGGEFSGISEKTTGVFLEAARFARGSVRATSRSLGLSSDSSKRFEKGVDFCNVELGRRRALALFSMLKAGQIVDNMQFGGAVEPLNDDCNLETAYLEKTITTNSRQINMFLGIPVPETVMIKILKSLGFGVDKGEFVKVAPFDFDALLGGAKEPLWEPPQALKVRELTVKIPLWREDVDNYTDLAEEVIRMYGYDRLAATPPLKLPMTQGGVSHRWHQTERLKQICCGLGAFEIKTFSFIGPSQFALMNMPLNVSECVKIANPLGEEYSLMRPFLASSILSCVKLNVSRQNDDFRIFETDNIFLPNGGDLPLEKKTLCAAFVGSNENFHEIKNLVTEIMRAFKFKFSVRASEKTHLHPGISADIIVDKAILGSFGKVHPAIIKNFDIGSEDVYFLEMDIEPFLTRNNPPVAFEPLPKFPSVQRDVSLTVDDGVSVGEIIDFLERTFVEIKKDNDVVVESIKLFDVYKGPQIEKDKKSVSIRLTLRGENKTLAEKEINEIMAFALKMLYYQFRAALRAGV